MVRVIGLGLWAVAIIFSQTITLENQVKSRIAALNPPATCTAGRLYINTLGHLYVCTSTNTWVARSFTGAFKTLDILTTEATRALRIGSDNANEYYDIYRDAGGGTGTLVFNAIQTAPFRGYKFRIEGTEYLGITSAGKIVLAGVVSKTNYVSYANNAAALAGGLVAGDHYVVTGTDPLQVAVVF